MVTLAWLVPVTCTAASLVGTIMVGPGPPPGQLARPPLQAGQRLSDRGVSGAVPAPRAGSVWPLAPRPRVVRTFDPPRTLWGPGHRGVDLSGHPGQVVRAARAGRIGFVGRIAGRGVVTVVHGALRTTYQPVEATVHPGQRVRTGQPIGVLHLGGSHCFPRACLHWGLLRGDVYLDPLILLGLGPVRLLPVP